jgi:RPA family protein
MESKYKRSTAHHVTLKQIAISKYVVEKEDKPNFIEINNLQIHRINIIAIITGKEKIGTITNMLLDDSTASIPLKIFEENQYIEKLDIGDCVMVIGKIRIYNEKKYISSEIIKKTNPMWLKLRNSKIKNNQESKINEKINEKETTPINKNQKLEKTTTTKKETIKEGIIEDKNKINQDEEIINESLMPEQKMLEIIKEIDNGKGANIEEVLEKSNITNANNLLKKMLESGVVFQNQPGKVKLL